VSPRPRLPKTRAGTETQDVPAVFVVIANFVSLAVVVAGIVRSGERTQVLLYAFILDYGLRLLTIDAVTGILRQRPLGRLAGMASFVCSPPAPGQPSHPVTEEGSGRPVGPGAYGLVVAFLASLAFVLGNVNANHEVDVDLATVLADLRWAVALALMYWIQSLASRSTVIDPTASREINFGYNTRDLMILAFATLTAGAVVVIRQSQKLPASGWVMLGPLLAFRFLYDLTTGLQIAARRQSPKVR